MEQSSEKLSMGTTSFLCKSCKAVTVVENLDLEKMTEFRCPCCDIPMAITHFAKVKMLYYGTLYTKLSEIFGEYPPTFETKIQIYPHYEKHE